MLARADQWSEGLHTALLRSQFVHRKSTTDGTSVLIKILPHRESRSLAVVVVPLTTFTPLYEGLTFRTLQRRIKSDHNGADGNDDDALYDSLIRTVQSLIREDSSIECELTRSEATMKVSTSSPKKSSLELDLLSLERESSSQFILQHLFLPLTSLAGYAVKSHSVQNIAEQDGLNTLFSDGVESKKFSQFCQMSNGLPLVSDQDTSLRTSAGDDSDVTVQEDKDKDTDEDDDEMVIIGTSKGTNATASSSKDTRKHTASASPQGKAASPRLKDTRSTSPSQLASVSNRHPDHDDEEEEEEEEEEELLLSSHKRTPQQPSRRSSSAAVAVDDQDKDEDDSMIIIQPKATPSNQHSQSDNPKSPSDDQSTKRDTPDEHHQNDTPEDQQPKNKIPEDRPKSATPETSSGSQPRPALAHSSSSGMSSTANRTGKLLAGSGVDQYMTQAHHQDADADTDADAMNRLSLSPEIERVSDQNNKDEGEPQQQKEKEERPPASAPARGGQAGRGASSYRRGLAKRKRI